MVCLIQSVKPLCLISAVFGAWSLNASPSYAQDYEGPQPIIIEGATANEITQSQISDSVSFLVPTNGQHQACDMTITGLPVVIEKPGVFCLARDLVSTATSGVAINIESDGVTIDGRGHCLIGHKGKAGTIAAIQAINQSRLSIENLCIDGFLRGINIGHKDTNNASERQRAANDPSRLDWYNYNVAAEDRGQNISLKNIVIRNSLFQGIYINADDFTIKNTRIFNIGGTVAYPQSFATGIYATGNFCRISGNTVSGLRPVGTGEGIGIAVYEGQGCTVENNTVIGSLQKGSGQRTYAIWVRPTYRQSIRVIGNHVSNVHYGMGPWGIYRDNVMTEIVCSPYTDRKRFFGGGDYTHVLDIDDSNSVIKSRGDAFPCIDELDYVIDRANELRTAEDAYRVALAYAEEDPVGGYYDQAEWLLIAAALGHEIAQRGVADYGTNPSYKDRYEKLKSSANKTMNKWDKKPIWKFP